MKKTRLSRREFLQTSAGGSGARLQEFTAGQTSFFHLVLKLKWKLRALLLEHLYGNFLEENDVFVAVVLQADVAIVRTRPALRLEVELFGRDWVTLGVIRDLHAIEKDYRVRSVQRDLHRVPLGARLAGAG